MENSLETSLIDGIVRALNPDDLADRILRQAMLLVDSADGAALAYRGEGRGLHFQGAVGRLAPLLGTQEPTAGSLATLAAVTGVPQRCDDAAYDPRVDQDLCRTLGVGSLIAVPISSDPQAATVLEVSSGSAAAFTDADIQALHDLADFLRATTAAAASVSMAAIKVLSRARRAGATHGGDPVDGDEARRNARFVANVLTPQLVDRVEARDRVEKVLGSDQFTIVVQPIVDLTTGEVVAGEALARFPGDRTPEEWFVEARAVGLGVELELAALEKAVSVFKELPEGIGLTVNVGPATLMSDLLAPLLAAAPSGWAAIELTGNILVSDYELINERLAPIRETGVMLTIDHTGGGQGTLSRILKLRPDVIKLDRELIRRIDSDIATLSLARTFVPFARDLGATLIAEGIERATEAEALLDIGITLGQGRLLGAPGPAGQLRRRSGWRPPAGYHTTGPRLSYKIGPARR